MSTVQTKVRKTLRIQSKENIDQKSSIQINENNKKNEDDDLNMSYESQGVLNHLRKLRKGIYQPSNIPKANHLIFDTMQIETQFGDDLEYKDINDNLDEWYMHTKSKLVDINNADGQLEYDEIKNKRQQKMLLDATKDKYKSPNLDQNILNSILHTNQNNENEEKYKVNSMNNNNQPKGRNSFSHIQYKQQNSINNGTGRNMEKQQSSQRNSTWGGGKNENRPNVFNVNAANTQGNICTSLTLLQQYNPDKEYLNPELIKKNKVQQIVNDIIQDKMKKIISNPKQYFQNEPQMKSTQDISSSVQNQTLKNFKNLRKYFTYGQKIDFNNILQNILTNKQLPHKLFNFTEDEINPASSFKDVEPELLNRYMNINKSIKEKKQQQRVFRIEVAKWVESLNNNYNELTVAQAKFDDYALQITNIDKQVKRVNAMQKTQASKQKSQPKSKQAINMNDNLNSEFDKLTSEISTLQKEQEKQNEKMMELKLIIKTLNQDIQVLLNHIQTCSQDVEKLKITRINLKTYLRQNYILMLKKDLRTLPTAAKENISFIWIIKSMNILGEHIDRSAFPQYIDEQSLTFLKQGALIEQELDDLRASIRNNDFTNIDLSQQKKDKYDKVIVNLNKSHTKQEIQKKLKSITADCLQVKKPTFQISQDTKKYEIQWVCDNLNENNDNPHYNQRLTKNGLDEEQVYQAVQQRQHMLEQIELRQNEYAKLKDKELMRLIQINEKREDPNLLKKFIVIFGTIEGAAEHHNYTHLTQCFLKKVQNNKNFSFMKNNRQFMMQNNNNNYNNNSIRSSERLSTAGNTTESRTDIDSMSMSSNSKLMSKRMIPQITSLSMTSLTDKYINTINGPLVKSSFGNSNNPSLTTYNNLGSNLHLDAFDTFMKQKPQQQLQTPKISRISTAFNTKSTMSKPYSTTSLRNLSINF